MDPKRIRKGLNAVKTGSVSLLYDHQKTLKWFYLNLMMKHQLGNLRSCDSHTSLSTSFTCSPMTHWPALIFSSSKCRACLSAYFTPISIFVSMPLVFACQITHARQTDDAVCSLTEERRSEQSVRALTMLASASSVVWT